MTEDDARTFLQDQGWILQMRPIAGVYNVIAKRVGSEQRVHLCSLATLDQQTKESLLALLNEEKTV